MYHQNELWHVSPPPVEIQNFSITPKSSLMHCCNQSSNSVHCPRQPLICILLSKNNFSWFRKDNCVVSEKTLESPLNCKESTPVNPKGNQSWIFIGRADAEGEAPVLWSSDVKSWLLRKDPDAGKDWRQEKMKMRRLDSITNLMDMSLSELWESGSLSTAVHGVAKTRLYDRTELLTLCDLLCLLRWMHLTSFLLFLSCASLYVPKFVCIFTCCWPSLVAQMVKNLPTMQQTGFNPWVRKILWRRKWRPTPVFLLGEFHGQRSLIGYSPWGRKEPDTTKRLTLSPAVEHLEIFGNVQIFGNCEESGFEHSWTYIYWMFIYEHIYSNIHTVSPLLGKYLGMGF